MHSHFELIYLVIWKINTSFFPAHENLDTQKHYYPAIFRIVRIKCISTGKCDPFLDYHDAKEISFFYFGNTKLGAKN